MERIALYARISQEDENIPSVENQLENVRKLAASRPDSEVVAEFYDNDISGYSGKVRPGFRDLLIAIEDKRVDYVLVVAVDRLSRNDQDSYLIRSYSAKAGVKWLTLAQGEIDPSTAAGGFNATLFGALAEMESAIKSERGQRSVQDRLRKGIPLAGRRLFGYTADRLTLIPEEADAIRDAYTRFLVDGESLFSLAGDWSARGITTTVGGTWNGSNMREVLRNPRHAGILMHKGEKITDGLPAIVTVEDWTALDARLADPTRKVKRGPKNTWLLGGIIRCVCGAAMYSARATQGHNIYKCKATPTSGYQGHTSIKAEDADDYVIIQAVTAIGEGKVKVTGADSAKLTALTDALQVNFRRIEHLQALTMDPESDPEDMPTYRAELKKARGERDELSAERERIFATRSEGGALAEYLSYVQSIPVDAEGATYATTRAFGTYTGYEAWKGMPIDKQRAILRGSFDVRVVKMGQGTVAERVEVKPS